MSGRYVRTFFGLMLCLVLTPTIGHAGAYLGPTSISSSVAPELIKSGSTEFVFALSKKKKKKLKLGKRTFKQTCQICHGDSGRFAGYSLEAVNSAFSSIPEMQIIKRPTTSDLKALVFYFSTLTPQ